MIHLRPKKNGVVPTFFEQITNGIRASIRQSARPPTLASDFVISCIKLGDYFRVTVYNRFDCRKHYLAMIGMSHVMKIGIGVALSFMALASVAQADEFKLSNNQRISCSRGLSAGKLNTATCKSWLSFVCH